MLKIQPKPFYMLGKCPATVHLLSVLSSVLSLSFVLLNNMTLCGFKFVHLLTEKCLGYFIFSWWKIFTYKLLGAVRFSFLWVSRSMIVGLIGNMWLTSQTLGKLFPKAWAISFFYVCDKRDPAVPYLHYLIL